MRRFKRFFLVRTTQCCWKSEEQKAEDTRHDSSVFFTNASLVKLAPVEGGNKDGGEELPNIQSILRLSLEVVESSHFEIGQIFSITPAGCKNVSKSKDPNKTIIGVDPSLCDIVLIPDEEHIEPKQCEITYDLTSHAYFISDLGEDTSGTYYKIEDKFVLHSEDLLAFGLSIVAVQIEERGSVSTLTLRFWAGPRTGEALAFGSNDEVIKIGRVADCSIKIDDANLSRHQCYIRFEPTRGWVVTDGDVARKPSANGTWLCVNTMKLSHGTTIRVGATSFKAHIVEDYE